MKIFFKNNRGIAALLTILIVGAATLTMVLAGVYLSLDEMDMSYIEDGGETSRFLAEACLVDAFRKLSIDNNYVSPPTLSIGAGSCIINTSAAGSEQVIEVVGQVGDYYKKITATISLADGLNVVAWEE